MASKINNDELYNFMNGKNYADMEDDDDELDDDDIDDIDNTDVNYNDDRLHIRLNNKGNKFEEFKYKLDISLKILKNKFPKIKELAANQEEPLEYILRKVFPDGMKKSFYVRNLSYDRYNPIKGVVELNKILGIRPERLLGDFLNQILPEGQSLIFKGHIDTKSFVVDEIYVTSDEERLDYESYYAATCYEDPDRVRHTNLYNLADESKSLTKHTRNRLEEWRAYLDWKKKIIEKKIYGCKYIKVDYDIKNRLLVFWLAAASEDEFTKFRKYLRSDDLQVYNNAYSKNRWVFEYNDDVKKASKGVSVGKFKWEDRNVNINNLNLNEIDGLNDIDNENNLDDWDDSDNEVFQQDNSTDLADFLKDAYIVKVAYELNSDDLEYVRDNETDEPTQMAYLKEEILSNYAKEGFLALSSVGSLVLNKRLQKALQSLENDTFCASPNLALWLFDVTKARKPHIDDFESEIEIDKWLNDSVANNKYQSVAVKKMLAAPDLCMVQGPPGTGKTTVIAEAIYQFVREGKRVLITSQSNDAVDNALDRLLDTPEIRAIRLGRKGKKKLKKNIEDIPENKYSEKEALRCFYHSVSNMLDKNWLDKWDDLSRRLGECERDLRDARLYNSSLEESNTRIDANHNNYNEVSNSLRSKRDLLEQYTNFNNDLEFQKQQVSILNKLLFDRNNYTCALERKYKDYLLQSIKSRLSEYKKKGVLLAPDNLQGLSASSSDQLFSDCLYDIACNFDTLENVLQKMQNSTGVSEGNLDLEVAMNSLRRKIKQIDDDLVGDVALDFEESVKKLNEKRKLHNELKKLEKSFGVISLSDYEESIFSAALLSSFKNKDNNAANIELLKNIIDNYRIIISDCVSDISKQINSVSPKDVSVIDKQLKRLEKEQQLLAVARRGIEAERSQCLEKLGELAQKYNTADQSLNALESHINSERKNVNTLLRQHSLVKDNWEATIRGLKEKLNDAKSYPNDLKYYNKTYINACNVVGISCTDNMSTLIENGFEDFDVVIVDEVSKATPPEILIPLLKANKAILVGDHRQLPPMFDEHERSYQELLADQEEAPDQVDFKFTMADFNKYKKMITASMFKENFEHADASLKASLFTQYRMHSDIMRVINRFYENRLENGLTKKVENKVKNHGLTIKGVDGLPFIIPQRHAYWLDSSCLPDGTPMYESFKGMSTSACNIYEAYLIVELLRKIAEAYTEQGYNKHNQKTVGVISFYQKQVNDIRYLFRLVRNDPVFKSINVDINTVDRFQGKEKNIIITSLVRNNKLGIASKHIVAFERINVAFSRAQEMLVIVGAKHLYSNLDVELPGMDNPRITTTPVYRSVIDEMTRTGGYIDSSKLVTEKLRQDVLAEYKRVKAEEGEFRK